MKLPQWLEEKRSEEHLKWAHAQWVMNGSQEIHRDQIKTLGRATWFAAFNACAALLLPEIEALRNALELERTCECDKARDPDCHACNALARHKEKFPDETP